MPYNVNWTTRVITVPVSDLVLVSGTDYMLDMSNFHKEIRRLEWAFDEGLPWPQIINYTRGRVLSNFLYLPIVELINGYTITFDPAASSVRLFGANNNIHDVLNDNGVYVFYNNTAGLQEIDDGIRCDKQLNPVVSETDLLADDIADTCFIIDLDNDYTIKSYSNDMFIPELCLDELVIVNKCIDTTGGSMLNVEVETSNLQPCLIDGITNIETDGCIHYEIYKDGTMPLIGGCA